MRLTANLTMLYTEVPFLERFAAAAGSGFKSVEFMFPYDYAPEAIAQAAAQAGVRIVDFNLPAGDWAAGERGIAADPARVDQFRSGVGQALAYARALSVSHINCLAGKANPAFSLADHWQTLADNVRFAADALGHAGLALTVEAINHYDVPGFVVGTTRHQLDLLTRVGRPNVYMQYDMYHAQREEGNIASTLAEHLSRIRHIQIADNPGRHQPGTGEINFPFLFAELERLGYAGYVGCEYIPGPDTQTSLGWIDQYLRGAYC